MKSRGGGRPWPPVAIKNRASTVKAPEELSAEELALITQYSKWADARGVLVGTLAQDGDGGSSNFEYTQSNSEIVQAPWDLRPMRVEGGIVTILRYSSPSVVPGSQLDLGGQSDLGGGPVSSASRSFERLAEQLAQLKSLPGLRVLGKHDGRVWFKRRFYPQLLSFPGVVEGLDAPRQFLLQLLGMVEELHRQEIGHGHLVPANVAVLDGEPVLLDIGWWSAQPAFRGASQDGFAPEVEAGFGFSLAADLYGVGLIISHVLRDPQSSEVDLVHRLLLREPAQRPALTDIRRVLEGANSSSARGWHRDGAADNADASGSGQILKQPPKSPYKALPGPGQDHRATSSSAAASSVKGPPKQVSTNLILVLVAALVLLVGVKLWNGFEPTPPYNDWWLAGEQQKVIDAALFEREGAAQRFLIARFRAGNTLPEGINRQVLELGLRPEWISRLNDDDRQLILTLAFLPLLEGREPVLPPMKSLRPESLLTLVANLPLERELPQLSELSSAQFEQLPGAFGLAFRLIRVAFPKGEGEQGTTLVSDRINRCLARFLGGDFSSLNLNSYFNEVQRLLQDRRQGLTGVVWDPVQIAAASSALLEALVETLTIYPAEQERAYQQLERTPFARLLAIDWFRQSSDVDWSKVSGSDKLGLIAGRVPQELYEDLLLFDALLFPNPKTRLKVAERVRSFLMEPGDQRAVDFIATGKHKFTREQVILLFSSLRLPRESQQTDFVSAWFQTEPDPESVLGLLLVRSTEAAGDLWNLFAARYLNNQKLQLNLEQLALLANHSEPLARALAYSQLRLDLPEQRAVLERSATMETSEALKKMLLERLFDQPVPSELQAADSVAGSAPGSSAPAASHAASAPNGNLMGRAKRVPIGGSGVEESEQKVAAAATATVTPTAVAPSATATKLATKAPTKTPRATATKRIRPSKTPTRVPATKVPPTFTPTRTATPVPTSTKGVTEEDWLKVKNED